MNASLAKRIRLVSQSLMLFSTECGSLEWLTRLTETLWWFELCSIAQVRQNQLNDWLPTGFDWQNLNLLRLLLFITFEISTSGFDFEKLSLSQLISFSSFPLGLASCGNPGAPQNGQKRGLRYWPGESVSFVCDPQYHLTGSVIRTCLSSGNWSGLQPSCKLSRGRQVWAVLFLPVLLLLLLFFVRDL